MSTISETGRDALIRSYWIVITHLEDEKPKPRKLIKILKQELDRIILERNAEG